MDFAKKQLEKYGWKEGEGLGKHKSGISKAIKPKLKFDTGGLGHDFFEDINNTWWQRLYDEAARNIKTKKNEDDSVVLDTVEQSIEITTNKKSKKIKRSAVTPYKNFIKTSELNDNIEKKVVAKDEDEEPETKKNKAVGGVCDYSDEELFRICGGRTAHKGARHGLKMNAKLARLQDHENSLISNNSDAPALENKKVRKKKANDT